MPICREREREKAWAYSLRRRRRHRRRRRFARYVYTIKCNKPKFVSFLLLLRMPLQVCVCVYVSLSECFIFTPPRIFWRARLSFESFEEEAKQNKTRKKIFANTHTYTANVFWKCCLIWKVLRRSSTTNFTYVFSQHTNTQSQGQSTWGRVFWACQWLSLLTQFVCLPPSLFLYRSRSRLRCRSLVFFS